MAYNIKIACSALVAIALAHPQLGFAQTSAPHENSISCSGFAKLQNGNWHASADNPAFDLGTAHQITMTNQDVAPRSFSLGGQDLYAALEAKCGKR